MDKIVNLTESWDEVKEKIKETHVELTDADLDFTSDRANEFLERLALKLNKSKEEVRDLIESIASTRAIAG